MKKIEQTISSIEVAEMVGKLHKNIVRDIRNYISEMDELKIEPVRFFRENTYKDSKGETRPCYNVTKKGCEFIAHKLTGVKGTEFTAKYINRFHDMEDTIRRGISQKPHKEKLPSVNQMVKNIKGALHDAGVDSKYIAAEVVRIYSDNGYPVKVPLISDVPVIESDNTNIDEVFEKVMGFLKTANATKKAVLEVEANVEKEKKKREAMEKAQMEAMA